MRFLWLLLALTAAKSSKKKKKRRTPAVPEAERLAQSNPLLEDYGDASAYFRETFGHLSYEQTLPRATAVKETLLLPRNALLRTIGDRDDLEVLSSDATTPFTIASALREALGDAAYASLDSHVTVHLVGYVPFVEEDGVTFEHYFQLMMAPILHGLLPRVQRFKLKLVGSTVESRRVLEAENGWFSVSSVPMDYVDFRASASWRQPTLFFAEMPGFVAGVKCSPRP